MIKSFICIMVLAIAGTAQASGYHRLNVTSTSNGVTETHTVFQSTESRGLLHNTVGVAAGWVCTADFASKTDDTFVLACMPMSAVGKIDQSRVMALGTCQDGRATLTVRGVTITAQCE